MNFEAIIVTIGSNKQLFYDKLIKQSFVYSIEHKLDINFIQIITKYSERQYKSLN
jgi:hypothetical protein